MKMNFTPLIFLILVGSIVSFNVQTTRRPNRNDPIRTVCTLISVRKEFATGVLKNIRQAASQSNIRTNFPQTLSYLIDAANQNKLTTSVTECQNFFMELEKKFQADVQKNGQMLTNIREQFLQAIKNITTVNPMDLIG